MDRDDYKMGRQPCKDFSPRLDGNIYAEWDNVHICIYCTRPGGSTVSFCGNCGKDHHFNGYETCERFSAQDARS